MKKHTTLILFLALLACVGFAAAGHYMKIAEEYEEYKKTELTQALGRLSSHVSAMGQNLKKLQNADGQTGVFSTASEISYHSRSAGELLSMFAGQDGKLDNIDLYVDKAGDYCLSLGRGGMDASDAENVRTLGQAHEKLESGINDLLSRVINGTLETKDLESEFSKLDSSFPDVPLTYDGAYSDHLKDRSPSLTSTLEKMAPEKALTNAAWYLSLPESSLRAAGESSGASPCYIYQGEGYTVFITKAGGLPVFFSKQGQNESARLSCEQALDAASKWLEAHGFSDMQNINADCGEYELYAEYCYSSQNVLFYPDKVRLTVSLADGTVTGMDASEFIMNHKSRLINAPALTSKNESSRLCVIHSPGKNEVLCWEEPLQGGAFSYRDAATGEQIDVRVD